MSAVNGARNYLCACLMAFTLWSGTISIARADLSDEVEAYEPGNHEIALAVFDF
jgi:hypothetical protein